MSAYEVAQRSILPVRTDHHSKPQVRFEDLAGGTYIGEYSAYCRPTSYFCGQLKWAWGPEIVQAGTLQCLPAGEPGHCNAQCRQLRLRTRPQKLNVDQHAYFVGLAGDVTGDCLLAFHYCGIFRETLALTSEPDLTLVQVHDVDGMCTDWGGCRGHSDAFEVNVEDMRKTNRVGVKY